MRRWLITILFVTSLFLAASAPHQADFEFSDIAVFYNYGDQVSFQAHVQSNQPADKAFLYVRLLNQNTNVHEIPLTAEGDILYSIDLKQFPLRPFTQVTYWYRLVSGTQEILSPEYTFIYEDNRITWQKTGSEHFIVSWLEGDAAFGQNVLNVVQNAYDNLSTSLSVEPPLPLRIYVYSTPQDLQAALSVTNEAWIAGHTDPDMGVILVSIPPSAGAISEIERQIPHEMAHVFLYQLAGSAYSNLPTWLVEGFASQAELYPNADYARALKIAADSDTLQDFSSMCSSFPLDASGAFLAYAQASSFTQYIVQTYGNSGLLSLIQQYSDNKGCEEGVQAALGASLSQVQTRWQQETLRINTGSLAWEKLRPFALVGLFVLLPPLFVGVLFRARR